MAQHFLDHSNLQDCTRSAGQFIK